jgi:hypothetical protein
MLLWRSSSCFSLCVLMAFLKRRALLHSLLGRGDSKNALLTRERERKKHKSKRKDGKSANERRIEAHKAEARAGVVLYFHQECISGASELENSFNAQQLRFLCLDNELNFSLSRSRIKSSSARAVRSVCKVGQRDHVNLQAAAGSA